MPRPQFAHSSKRVHGVPIATQTSKLRPYLSLVLHHAYANPSSRWYKVVLYGTYPRFEAYALSAQMYVTTD